MGIQEEIFENFFKKLKEDEQFPNSIVEALRSLQESGKLVSQENIFNIIKRERENVGEGQKD